MKYLRTVSTGRLLALLAGLVVAIAAGTAIAVASTGSGPVPKAKPLAQALHGALAARPVNGISADIQFTNNLISSTNFTGGSRDPILQGATGRLWLSKANGLRLELQSPNGDSQVIVNNGHFWVSDPASQTVYQGTIPAGKDKAKAGKKKAAGSGMPTVAQIQTGLNHLLGHVHMTGARTSNPSDIAGQPAYSVKVSPKHDGGLLGSAQIAWDAITGTPLNIAIYARGNSSPVLQMKVTNISFGPQAASTFDLKPPAGYKVVKVSAPASQPKALAGKAGKGKGKHAKHVSGLSAVARAVPFHLAAPAKLVGLPRQSTTLLDWGGHPAALVTYGQNLGGVAIIEQKADAASSQAGKSGSSSSAPGGLSLPSVQIKHATGTELSTALGTVLRVTSGGVAYTVLGSVEPFVAEQAAKALIR